RREICRREWPPGAGAADRLAREDRHGQRRPRDDRQREERAPKRVGGLVERDRIVHPEGAARQAAERAKVGGDTEPLSEVAGERADVVALRNEELDLERTGLARSRLDPEHVEREYADRSRRELRRLAATGQRVTWRAGDLDRRVRRRHLFGPGSLARK